MTPPTTALTEIDTSSAVLFLGSGFSLEGANLYDRAPPNGARLRRHFIEKLNLPPDTSYDLQVLAEEFASKSEISLYRELYNLFHIAKVGPNQEALLRHRWLHVYTTNYDDTVQVCHKKLGFPIHTYATVDQLPNKIAGNSVVHLHGSIGRLNEDNALDQLILGESSYVKQYISKSPWYTQFQGDIRFASNLFILGYSLSDYHIAALLLEAPLLAQRTFFVQPEGPDPIFLRRTRQYGQTLFVGLDGFANLLHSLPRRAPLSDVTRLKSFKYLDPLRDKKGLRPPTSLEVLYLLIYGTFNYSRCVATLPDESYVISRPDEVDKLLALFQTARSVIVDSRLGNGKTIFLYLAFLALAEMKYNCFMFRSPGPTLDQEIEALKRLDKLLIIFDEYTSSQDVIGKIAGALPNAKFIVEIRSSILSVRYHEVSQDIPRPYARLSLNRLSREDVTSFRKLCEKAGISTTKLQNAHSNLELRELLLELLDSPNIKAKIEATLRPIVESRKKRQVLLIAMLLGRFHLSADAGFIKTVTGADPYHEFRDIQEIADELFEMDLERFCVRSAVFSDFAVQVFLDAEEMSDTVVEAALAAAQRKADRIYRVLMSNLLQYSNVAELFRKEVNSRGIIIKIYERLRHDRRLDDEPLFWLQYAIAVTEASELVLAEQFIQTAYDRAKSLPGFLTYQIDTQACRILLLIETEAPNGTPVVRIQDILEKLQLLDSMLGEESHRSFVLKVLEYVEPLVRKRRADFTIAERTALTFWLSKLSNTLTDLPAEYRAVTGSDLTKRKLEAAKALLL